MRLTSVVLPAPLEPMSESTSPWLTTKSTLLTARFSPNDFAIARVERRLISARSPHFGNQKFHHPHDSLRQRQHQHYQHGAEQQLPVDREPDRVGLEIGERHGADDGANKAVESPENGHENDLAGEGPYQGVGRREPV